MSPDDLLKTLVPKDLPAFVVPMWASALYAASGNKEIRAAFEADTGLKVHTANSVLDRMIDQATGRDEALIRAFAEWFNANVWGPWE